jgi:hypothetical protein
VTGCVEYNNEPLVSIRGSEFLDHLSDYQFLKKGLVRGMNLPTNRYEY